MLLDELLEELEGLREVEKFLEREDQEMLVD